MVPRVQAALFVDRASRQWVVRDPDGQFWIVPMGERPWDLRQPVADVEQLKLVPVPGHYKHMLALPF